MIFEIRAIDEEVLREKCLWLQSISGEGDPGVRERIDMLLQECRQQLDSEEFRLRHETYLALVQEGFRPKFEAVYERRRGWQTNLFTLCVKLLAMPGYQGTPLDAPVKSDTVVFIGDYDAGLHRFLFGSAVLEALETRLNTEGLELLDGWMVMLTEEERGQLEGLIDALLERDDSAGKRWRVYAVELSTLLRRARNGEFGLSISYSPERSL